MLKYESGQMRFSSLVGSVVLPPFQRRLVWSKGQKEDFIQTLSNGYPFGSILIYKYQDDLYNKKYTLIDGLQRYSTIKDFQKHPEKYMDFDDIVGGLYNLISLNNSSEITVSVEKKLKDTIKKTLYQVIESRDEYSTKDFPWALVDKFKEDELSGYYDSKFDREIVIFQTTAMENINNHIDVENIVIPYIEFKGDENELATVFENLNRGGKKLSKYQVFAAQWSNNGIKLGDGPNNSKILEKVISRYENLIRERDINIENFDADLMRKTKSINLAELCGAIGQLILEASPVFWAHSNTNSIEDKANAIGYSSVAVTLGVSNKKLSDISKHISFFNNSDFLETYITNILDVYSTINNYFEKYLSHPGISATKKFESKQTADFQFLSFFASLWISKYTFNKEHGNFEIIPRYKNNYQRTMKNFIYYYIEDILVKRWSGTGDAKLDQIYIERNNRYSKALEKEVLEESLKKWWDERSITPSINFDQISRTLLTVQSSFYDSQYRSHSYDFEHVISKSLVDKIYKQDELSAGSLGNIMFLDSSFNRSKKNTTLYEVLQEGHSLDEDYVNNVLYPSESSLDDAFNGLNKKQKNSSKAKELIITRGNHMINNLIQNLYR